MTPPPTGFATFSRIRPAAAGGLIMLAVCLGLQVTHAGSLSSVAPAGASAGVAVAITGTGFDPTAANNSVTFTPAAGTAVTAPGASIVTLDATSGLRRLSLNVPAGLPAGTTALRVVNKTTGEASAGQALEILTLALPDVSSGAPGATNLAVRVTGSPNVRFVAGSTRPAFGAGVTVNSTVVESQTSLVATISIATSALIGARDVSVLTNTQTARLAGGFIVQAAQVNRPPVANAGGPYGGLVGQSIAFSGVKSTDPDGDALTYSWNFGDGSVPPATGTSPSHTYAAVGDFAVTLTVTDSHGAANSASTSAHITQANTVPVANAGGPYAGTVGQTVAFSGSLSSDADHDPLTYAWNFGDGTTAAASAVATTVHSYSAKGTFTVTVTVNDGRGGIASAGTNAVIAPANSPPIASAGGPYNGTTGQPVSFSATASDPDNDPLTYTWDFGDGSTPPGAGATPSHTYTLANDYTVRVSVSDGHGGSTSAISSAHIVLANRAPTANPGGPYSGTAGQPVSFNGTASSDPDSDTLTYSWDFGDGTPPAANATATPTHAYTAGGDYTARLTVGDGRGGTSTNGALVHIVAQNAAPVVSAGQARTITFPAAASLAGTASDDGLPAGSTLTMLWTKVSGPGSVSFTSPATPATTAAFDQAGTYVLRLTANDSQLSTSADVTLTVGQADATIQVNGYNGVYDGKPHAATGSAAGVNAEDLAALLHIGGSFTDAPGGSTAWTFDGNTNYKAASGTAAIVIAQASATIQVAGFSGVFDGSAHGATGSAIGVNGETLSTLLHLGASFTEAPGGVAQWTFDGNTDYKPAAGSVPITITAVAQPDATIQVAGFTGVYDGNAHGATGTATGANGESLTNLLHLGASFTDVPGGTAHWTFDGNATYRAKSGDVAIAIASADATVHVTGFTGVEDGQAHGATGTATGIKGENLFGLLTLGSSFSASPGGTAHWTFAGNADYKAASGDVTIAIAPAGNRLPPVITLSAPKEALPGAKVTITAGVSDNVTSVQLQVDQSDPVTVTGPPYQRLITIADVATPGTSITVRGTALDSAGGIGTASTQIKIVAEPDTTKPAVSLKVPPQAAPGSSIVITAIASDNVGVDAVGFSVNGTPFASAANAPYQVTYVVPADTAAQSVLTFSALAADAAGNRAQSDAIVAIVQTPDTAPPSVTVAAPPTVLPATAVKVTADANAGNGVASVGFYVDGTLASTAFDAPYEATIAIPAGAAPGSHMQVEARAFDRLGLEASAAATMDVVAAGAGVLSGTVFDDSIGLPVAGASVTLNGLDARGVPYGQSTISDSRGRYVVHATEGQGTVQITKPGWTRLDRPVAIQPNAAIQPLDARLRIAGITSDPIPAVSGGTITAPALDYLAAWRREIAPSTDPSLGNTAIGGPDVEVRVPPGALSLDTALTLTPVSRQGLAGLLPIGWTPIAIVDITPHGIAFSSSANLKVPVPLTLAAGSSLTVARWDETASRWRAVATSAVGQNAVSLETPIDTTGQYAWLFPDTLPLAPPQPAAGELVDGVAAVLIPADASAVVDPQPRILFYKPGVKSDVRARVTTTAPLSSGTLARTRLTEAYQFFSGAELSPDQTVEDLVLYQIPGAGPLTLVAGFPVAPSLIFEALTLQKGTITVELRAPGELQQVSALIGADGGSVQADSGERLDVTAGALATPLPIAIRALGAAEIGVPAPDGFEIIEAVSVSADSSFATPAALSIARPTTVADADTVLVARLQELAGRTRFVVIGAGTISSNRIVSATTLSASAATFEGILLPGRYVFLRATTPVAFAAGTVAGIAGGPFAGAMVGNSATAAIVALSRATGGYVAPIAVGAAPLTAIDPVTSDSASGQTNADTPRQVIALDFALNARPPTVTTVTPANGTQSVSLTSAVVVTFSAPVDPTTITAASVQLSSSAGTVAGKLEFSSGNRLVTFRSTQPLAPNTAYTLNLATTIKDPFGRVLPAPFATSFTSLNTIAPPPPPAGTVSASIPGSNGTTTITVTQGAMGSHDTVLVKNVTKGTLTPIQAIDPSVGFTVVVQAAITDKLQLVIQSATGVQTTADIPPFRQTNADGSVSQAISNTGGHIDGPAGIGVDVQNGTFPDGAVVTISPVSDAQFPFQLTDAQRQFFTYSGGLKLDFGGKRAQIYLNVSIPAAASDNEADRWMVVRALPVGAETVFDVADTARVINGRIATSSPPCPGVAAAAVYGFLRSSSQLSVLTGAGGIVPNPEARNASYFIAANAMLQDPAAFGGAGLAMPGIAEAGVDSAFGDVLLHSTTFCVPVVSGKVTGVPNRVEISVDPVSLTDADVELVVSDVNPVRPTLQQQHLYRPFPASVSLEGSETDAVQVLALAADGMSRTIDPVHVQQAARKFVIVDINNVFGDYRALVVLNRQTGKQIVEPLLSKVTSAGQLAPIHLPLVRLILEGLPTDEFDVSVVDRQGVSAPFSAPTVTAYNVGTGNMLFSALRGTIDPTPAEIDTYNANLQPGDTPVDRQGGTTRVVLESYLKNPTSNTLIAGPAHVLLDVDAGINETIDGGFYIALEELPNSIHYLSVQHANGSEDRAKLPEFVITVINHTTNAAVRRLTGLVPSKNDTVVINVYGDGSATPTLETSPAALTDVDPSAPIQLTFSAPVDRSTVLGRVTVVDSAGKKIDGDIVMSSGVFSGSDSVITFIPKNPLVLDEVYSINLVGVLDLLGRPLAVRVVPVTTYTPRVEGMYSALNIDGQPFTFNDLQVMHDKDSAGNPRTSLIDVSSNDSGFKLHAIDVTDPQNPLGLGEAGGGHLTRRVALRTNVSLPLAGELTSCNQHVANRTFKGALAVGTSSDVNDTHVMFYDVTDPKAPCTLAAKTITTNPEESGTFVHGTFRILGLGAGGVGILQHSSGYAAYMAIREVGTAALDVGQDIPETPLAQQQTEGLFSGDYTDVITVDDARILALNNNFGSGATLDVLDPSLSPIASMPVDVGASAPGAAGGMLAHQVAYAGNVGVDKNGDGAIDDSEVFAFAYVGGQAGITIVDMTDSDNPAPVATIPIKGIVRQVAASADGRRLYVGGDDSSTGQQGFFILDVSNPFAAVANRVIYERHYIEVERIQVDPERPYVYVARKDGIDIITTEPPNLSGIVSFDWYPVDIDSTDPTQPHPYIDYSRGFVRPVRGAIVELHDQSDAVLAKTNLTVGGYYAFHAPANANLTVVVTAQLGAPRNPEVRVEDRTPSVCPANDQDCHLYKVRFDVTTTNERVTKDYAVRSGWDAGAFTGPRDAAPFAILDTVFQAKTFVKGVDPNRTYPLLTLDWGPTLVEGSDHTPFFNPTTKRITLNGLADVDTDEYDAMVVLHEFGHFVQDTVGRDDGLGGSHALTDHLDPPTAFSEGFATAFAGVVANTDRSFADTNICDGTGCTPALRILDTNTSGAHQAGPGCFSSIDTDVSSCPDPNVNLKGFDSETGIASLIWNISAGATTNLGLDSVYTALNRTAVSPAFASIFTFLQKLKELVPASRPDITALASTMGVADGDEFDTLNREFYSSFQIGSGIGDFIEFDTSDKNGAPTTDSPGNDLFNWVYVKFDVPQPGGCFSLTLDPRINPDQSTPKLQARLARPGREPLTITGAPAVSTSLSLTAGTHSLAVGAYLTSTGVTTAHFRMRMLPDSPGACVP